MGDTKETGTSNVHGDSQLELDVAADTLIFAKLRECGAVETASSEETSEMVSLGGQGFSVRLMDLLDADTIWDRALSTCTTWTLLSCCRLHLTLWMEVASSQPTLQSAASLGSGQAVSCCL